MSISTKVERLRHFPAKRLNQLKLPLLCASLLLCLTTSCINYAPRPPIDKKNARAFDLDAPPKPRIKLTEDLGVGINAMVESQYEDNFDLVEEDPDALTAVKPSLDVAVSYTPFDRVGAFVNVEAARVFFDDEEEEKEDETMLLVKQAYVSLNDIVNGLDVKAGRQRFKDEREWIYDEEMDGLRIFQAFRNFAVDASVSRRHDPDLLHGADDEHVTNYALFGSYAFGKKNFLSAYGFLRDDGQDEEKSLIFYGLSMTGEATKNLDYWLELGHVREKDGPKIRGYGLDIGSTYELPLPLKPSITLGYAFGTGDDDPADDTDENFRQTGLQDNNAAFNGITRFKYYGEAFDPELSNLGIITGGIGIRPTRKVSVDVVYHYYRQHTESTNILDSNLDIDPDGLEKELGHEVDVILGLRSGSHLKASLAVGYFIPGKAFSDDADDALFAEIKLQYSF